jgi:LPXTG-motif cell wall-anchored protein
MPSTNARVGTHAGHLRLFARLFVALAVAMISTPLLLAPPASAVSGDLCKDIITEGENGWTDISDGSEDNTVHYEAPDGFLIDAYCVKAGSEPDAAVIIDVDPPVSEIDIDHPVKDSVSHYAVHLIPAPEDECAELPGDQPDGFQCEPLDERETRDLQPLLDCDGGTITVVHEERTRIQELIEGVWVFGEWSEWAEYDRTVTEAPAEDCAIVDPPDPIVDPPNPIVDPPNPIVDPPAETPTLPNTGSPAMLGALGLMGALILAAGATLLMRARKLGAPGA